MGSLYFCAGTIPASGETAETLAAGGRGEGRPLPITDRWICDQCYPITKRERINVWSARRDW